MGRRPPPCRPAKRSNLADHDLRTTASGTETDRLEACCAAVATDDCSGITLACQTQ